MIFPEKIIVTQKYISWFSRTFYPHNTPFIGGDVLTLAKVSGQHGWYTRDGEAKAPGASIFDFELYLVDKYEEPESNLEGLAAYIDSMAGDNVD